MIELQKQNQFDRKIIYTWNTTGLGESDIAIRIHQALTNFKTPHPQFEIGYRVNFPNVEVKIELHESNQTECKTIIETITKTLEDICIETSIIGLH